MTIGALQALICTAESYSNFVQNSEPDQNARALLFRWVLAKTEERQQGGYFEDLSGLSISI